MALVVSGGTSIDPDTAARLCAEVPTASPRPRVPAAWGRGERWTGHVRALAADEEAQVEVTVALPGTAADDPDRSAMAVMNHVLGSGMGSRLFHTVRERHGLCYRIGSGHDHFDDAGMFVISTATRPGDAVRALELSRGELLRLADEAVPEDELRAARASMVGRLLRGTETAGSSAHWYASRWRAGLPLETPDDRAAAIDAVSAQDVTRAARRIAAGLADARLAFVGPEEQGAELLGAVTG